MFEVTAEETIQLAKDEALSIRFIADDQDHRGRPGITWTRLAFEKMNKQQAPLA
jgi:hypothetical protein